MTKSPLQQVLNHLAKRYLPLEIGDRAEALRLIDILSIPQAPDTGDYENYKDDAIMLDPIYVC